MGIQRLYGVEIGKCRYAVGSIRCWDSVLFFCWRVRPDTKPLERREYILADYLITPISCGSESSAPLVAEGYLDFGGEASLHLRRLALFVGSKSHGSAARRMDRVPHGR